MNVNEVRMNEGIKNKKPDYVCLQREMISFWMCEEEKERKVHHPISLKGNKESKGDFTRMKMKNKIHFPCVKLRRRMVSKKGRKA